MVVAATAVEEVTTEVVMAEVVMERPHGLRC
jgi:hypothetical protein